ncbi:MAG: hypothetical protein ACOX44_10735 [Limnochordia bacterium]
MKLLKHSYFMVHNTSESDSEDIGVKSHQLIDTCSFSRLIADYLNGDTDGKTPMLMGIAALWDR